MVLGHFNSVQALSPALGPVLVLHACFWFVADFVAESFAKLRVSKNAVSLEIDNL